MATNNPDKPKNSNDLKKILKHYDNILTPQNKQFINELINNLEKGSDKNELQDLAKRMTKAANKAQKGQNK